MVHELTFEYPEEAFDTGIIPPVARAAHTRRDAMRGEQMLVPCRGHLGCGDRSGTGGLLGILGP